MKINITEDKVYVPARTRLVLIGEAELQRGTPHAPYGRAVRAVLDSIPHAFREPAFDKFPYILAGQPERRPPVAGRDGLFISSNLAPVRSRTHTPPLLPLRPDRVRRATSSMT